MKQRVDYLTNLIAAVGTTVQPEEIFQWISFILTIVSVALSICFTIYQWWKAASADGKITASEAAELVGIVEEAKENIEKIEVKK